MNRQILQSASGEWVRQAKNDIRNKIIEFMDEVDTTREELAYALAISEGELAQILEGNGEITLTTFAKLLIATGNALEIKPIEETPLATEFGAPIPPASFGDEHPHHPCRHHHHDGHMCRRPGAMPPPPRHFDDFERIVIDGPDDDDFGIGDEEPQPAPVMQPRGRDGRFRPWPRQPQPEPEAPRSPFADMEREQLVEIIQNKLWDTEIDVDNVSREQLVHFLEDKDKRMVELREARDRKKFEEDPSVLDFIAKVKKAVEENPNLNSKLKDILR